MRKAIVATILLACAVLFAVAYRKEQKVDRGRAAFARYGCASCHFAGGAPNLQNVGKKYDRKLLEQFLCDPESVYRTRGYQPLNKGFQPMPRLKMATEDASDLAAYLDGLSD